MTFDNLILCFLYQGDLKKITVEKMEEYVVKDDKLPVFLDRYIYIYIYISIDNILWIFIGN